MPNTDIFTLWLIHGALVLVLIICLIAQFWMNYRRKSETVSARVERGPESMNVLFVMYGIVTLVFSLAVQTAECARYHKSTLIIFDYLVWTYLFFWNTPFRGKIFSIYIRMKRE